MRLIILVACYCINYHIS